MRAGGDLVGVCRQSGLIPSKAEIGVGRIGGHRYPRAELFGLRGLGFGARRLASAPQTAKKVDLPARAKADVIERRVAVEPWEVAAEPCGGAFERLMHCRGLGAGADRGRQLRAGFAGA